MGRRIRHGQPAPTTKEMSTGSTRKTGVWSRLARGSEEAKSQLHRHKVNVNLRVRAVGHGAVWWSTRADCCRMCSVSEARSSGTDERESLGTLYLCRRWIARLSSSTS